MFCVAAMALGRIGQAQATVPLLECYSAAMDPFLKHAITYAIYEIGDQHSLSPKHSVTKRVQRMLKLDRTTIRSAKYPEIEFVQADKPDSEAVARQKEQLDTLAAFLPQGDSQRGEKLFHNREKAKCVTCHLKGSEGVRLGPDLTRIGTIRSERDLLEAIVLPSRIHRSVSRNCECHDKRRQGRFGATRQREYKCDVSRISRGCHASSFVHRYRPRELLKCFIDA